MIFLALRHLLSRRRQTMFTLAGILLGTLGYVVISGFFIGFQNFMTNQLVSGDAHVKITRNDEEIPAEAISQLLVGEEFVQWIKPPSGRLKSEEIRNPSGWLELAQKEPDVTAIERQYTASVIVSSSARDLSVSLIGVEVDQHLRITNLGEKVIEGDIMDIARGMSRIAIGKVLKDELGLHLGDRMMIKSTSGRSFPMKIVAIFEMGNRQSDRTKIYTGLADAQSIGGGYGQVSQIAVKVREFLQASSLANKWKITAKEKVESWDQSNSGFMSMFQVQDIMKFGVVFVILVVAGFSIYNILTMVVMQKRRDIAILRSMGYTSRDIIWLFLSQGLILGVSGSFIGSVLGFLVCSYLSTLNFGPSGKLTIAFEFGIYVKAFFLGIGSAAIASYLPARSASRMTPIEIIRAGAE